MAIDLRSLKKKSAVMPPRVLVYGPPGKGKTSLAAEFPNAIFIQTEDGTPGDREIANFPKCTTFAEVLAAVDQLKIDEHYFTTLVIDSLDKLEPLVWDQAIVDNKWKNIEDPGYGKGYAVVDNYWRSFIADLEWLRINRGMTIVYIAHSDIARFDSPTSQSYNRYDIRLHKRALAIFQDDVDAILFINEDPSIKTEKGGFGRETTRADGGGTLWIHSVGRPAFTAKNRYGIPDKVIYKPFEGYNAIGGYLPAQIGQYADADPEPEPVKPARKKTSPPVSDTSDVVEEVAGDYQEVAA